MTAGSVVMAAPLECADGAWVRSGAILVWVETPTPAATPPACGTDAAYRRHLRLGEPTCQPCRDAHTIACGGNPRPPLQPCGTHAAFNRHRSRGEKPCDACRAAERTFQNNRPRRHRKVAAA